MTSSNDIITINVRVDLSAASLQAIVQAARNATGTDDKGFYHVDTADWAGKVISDFLKENNFEAYARKIEKKSATHE